MEALYRHCTSVLWTKYQPNTVEFMMLVTPILGYWVLASIYDHIDSIKSPWLDTVRIVRKEKGMTNTITKGQVIRRVILQHVIQAAVNVAMTLVDPQGCDARQAEVGWAGSISQWIVAMFIMDTWQYCVHRAAHESTFLYKHVHSTHHR